MLNYAVCRIDANGQSRCVLTSYVAAPPLDRIPRRHMPLNGNNSILICFLIQLSRDTSCAPRVSAPCKYPPPPPKRINEIVNYFQCILFLFMAETIKTLLV